MAPAASAWQSEKLERFLQKFEMKLFAPSFGNYKEGHYDTFLQSCTCKDHTYGDSEQPNADDKNLGKCKNCPSYYFKSKADVTRHTGMFHRRHQGTYVEASFSCVVCKRTFTNKASMNRHKKEEKHTHRELGETSGGKRKASTDDSSPAPAKKSKKTKQHTINDVLRGMRKDCSHSESDQEDPPCGARSCLLEDDDEPAVVWVQCGRCSVWFHTYCVGLGNKTEREIRKMDFVCKGCKKAASQMDQNLWKICNSSDCGNYGLLPVM